ncbi:DNA mismatch endonuclease Vsr [Sphingomonas sp. CGMCC 1.13654]|uniref:Very short patch repair endonuclease n=1 Tax=Sphingomonas chungangi TaxID=2683589 RepID=A0A838L293_9SPHN|nr:very short patch repair endonuclease [Sphingomonas chungangi]MBA2933040.1 DNA mismatch endonuclease Vsr [Sphingomonas chungangi]MVW56660.1 DNA mismatch endonuclease Vsr [Sphingomonas chungangi]
MEPEAKRSLMARFKGKNTRPEILVRQLLNRSGYRFRLHRRDLPGTPDIILPRHRIAIFVHGCFWHHHEGCRVAKVPASRSEFWRTKFATNKERDARNEALLEKAGWKVITIWECEARGDRLETLLSDLGLPPNTQETSRSGA